jgi:hypothetical protein
MFFSVAGSVCVTYFDLMPFGLSPLWLVPLLFIVLAYYSMKKAAIDRKVALGIVSDPGLLAAVMQEVVGRNKEGGC